MIFPKRISTLLCSATFLISVCSLPSAYALELTLSDGPVLKYFNGQVDVDPDLILTHDEPTIDGLRVRIANAITGDTLDIEGAIAAQYGVSASFDNVPNRETSWTLTLTGTASIEDYETILRTIRIWSGTDSTPRTVEFLTLDWTQLAEKTALSSQTNSDPEASDNTVTTLESTQYSFSKEDFGFNDPDGIYARFDHLTIKSLPSAGSLTYYDQSQGISTNAQIDQEISPANLSNLRFDPVFQENGSSYAVFDFTVNDSFADSAYYTITIDVTSVNDLPVITPTVRNDVTELDAVSGTVLLTFTAIDPEEGNLGSDVYIIDNDEGYFTLSSNQVRLSPAGAALVNSGYALPKVELRVLDSEAGLGSATIEITSNLINDPPELSTTRGPAVVEASVQSGDLILSFVADDQEHGILTADVILINNTNAYYEISGDRVLLTQAAVAYVNAGNLLPNVELSVTDPNGLSSESSTPIITTLVNDDPQLILTLGADVEEDKANSATVVATFVAYDEERTPIVSFSAGTNNENYYTITGGSVSLTTAGANFVNAGGTLPSLSLTVTDAQNANQRVIKQVSPQVILVNDTPVLRLNLDSDIVEDQTTSATVVATFTVSDEEGTPIMSFTGASNSDGYYRIVGTNVLLSQVGSDYVNAGGTLPQLSLSATDDADNAIVVSESASPVTIILNDKPTLELVLTSDIVEGTAQDGSLVANFTADDEEGTPIVDFTSGNNSEGYYRLIDNTIELTQAGADFVNTGGTLPAISLTATDDADNNLTAGTTKIPGTRFVNDSPYLSLSLGDDVTEDSANAGDAVAAFVVTDEDGTPIMSFTSGTNDAAYYQINGTTVVLTQEGADFVNTGNTLPPVSLTATDDADNTIQIRASQSPVTVFVNDPPAITLTLLAAIKEDTAVNGSAVATFDAKDEDGTPLVDFAANSNGDGYFQISTNTVTLTQAGADHVNAGKALPALTVTATDNADNNLSATASATPSVTFVNDPPSISLSLAATLVEDSTDQTSLVANFIVSDEDGTPVVDFANDSNPLQHYQLAETRVELTQAGADFVNGGGSLAPFSLIATDDADSAITRTTDSVQPLITAVNDTPVLNLVLGDYVVVSRATTETIVARFTASDEDGTPTIDFTSDSNAAGMYILSGTNILLTQVGANAANAASNLPPVRLTIVDDSNPTIAFEKSVQPEVVEDSDLDGIPNDIDTDDDGDGIADADEGYEDSDNDGLPNNIDLDSDNDGISDEDEGLTDSDGDGTPDFLDTSLDEDFDGIPDIVEGTGDVDFDGIPNFLDIDSDGDGMTDSEEAEVSGQDSDGDGIDDSFDIDLTDGQDLDGDGIDDSIIIRDSDRDGKPNYLDRDSDNDYIPDAIEAQFDNYDVDGDGQPNHLDQDSDNDGIGDRSEGGASLKDADNDGIDDAFDIDYTGGTDADGNGIDDDATLRNSDGDASPDLHDLDSDNDGIFDTIEAGVIDKDTDALADPEHTLLQNPKDTDNDKMPDYIDIDSDNDGIYDIVDSGATLLDTDVDGQIDPISDGDLDGIDDQWDEQPTVFGSSGDLDGDGIPDSEDSDIDGDGIDNAIEGEGDFDGDGLPNKMDRDSDGDGISDAMEYNVINLDADNDGQDNYLDTDSDNDGISDTDEQLIGPFSRIDVDRDGIDDSLNANKTGGIDSNNDGIDDSLVSVLDLDGDGLLAYLDTDSDGDGMDDRIENGDYNKDGIPDYRQYNGRVKTGVKGGGALDFLFTLMLLGFVSIRIKGLKACKG